MYKIDQISASRGRPIFNLKGMSPWRKSFVLTRTTKWNLEVFGTFSFSMALHPSAYQPFFSFTNSLFCETETLNDFQKSA